MSLRGFSQFLGGGLLVPTGLGVASVSTVVNLVLCWVPTILLSPLLMTPSLHCPWRPFGLCSLCTVGPWVAGHQC
jgi:hypothetical protein